MHTSYSSFFSARRVQSETCFPSILQISAKNKEAVSTEVRERADIPGFTEIAAIASIAAIALCPRRSALRQACKVGPSDVIFVFRYLGMSK